MTNETIQNPTVEKESLAPASCRAVTPRYQAAENPDAYVLTVFVPGSATADVETIVEGDRLVVNARRRWTAPSAWTPVHREIATADYRLVLQLDRRVNRDAVKAQLSQGVLTLTLPKAEELKPRRIEIAG
jgi:HSP20 family protein